MPHITKESLKDNLASLSRKEQLNVLKASFVQAVKKPDLELFSATVCFAEKKTSQAPLAVVRLFRESGVALIIVRENNRPFRWSRLKGRSKSVPITVPYASSYHECT